MRWGRVVAVAMLGGAAGWGVSFGWSGFLREEEVVEPLFRAVEFVGLHIAAVVPNQVSHIPRKLPFVSLVFFPGFAMSAWLIQRLGAPQARLRLPHLLLVSVFAAFLCAATALAFHELEGGLRRALSVLHLERAWVAVCAHAVAWCLFWSWRSERMRNAAENPRL